MNRRNALRSLAFLAMGWAAVVGLRPASAADFHFRLERTAPAADSTVAPPEEVRLWFSEGAQEGATSIRLLDPAGELVTTGDLWSSEDRSEHAVAVSGALANGRYTVAWRSMAGDGHVQRGEFQFTVRATR